MPLYLVTSREDAAVVRARNGNAAAKLAGLDDPAVPATITRLHEVGPEAVLHGGPAAEGDFARDKPGGLHFLGNRARRRVIATDPES